MKTQIKLKFFLNLITALLSIALFLTTGCSPKENPDNYTIGVILAESGPADFAGKPEAQVLRRLQEQYRASNINGV